MPLHHSSLSGRRRALLVDMECGPLNETMRGPLGPLFTETQYVMDVYGAGRYHVTLNQNILNCFKSLRLEY